MKRLHKDTVIQRHVDYRHDGGILREHLFKWTGTVLLGTAGDLELRRTKDGYTVISKDHVVLSRAITPLTAESIGRYMALLPKWEEDNKKSISDLVEETKKAYRQ